MYDVALNGGTMVYAPVSSRIGCENNLSLTLPEEGNVFNSMMWSSNMGTNRKIRKIEENYI